MKQYPPLSPGENIVVYEQPGQILDASEPLGQVIAADRGSTIHCDSLTMINLVKEEARKVGGNAVLIVEHQRPSFWGSSCHQFVATILRTTPTALLSSSDSSGAANTVPYTYNTNDTRQRQLPRFSFGTDIGAGWRLNRISSAVSSDARRFYENLRFGLGWGAYGDYFFNDNYGIRLSYQGAYNSYGEKVVIINDDDLYIGAGTLSLRNTIHYVGPAFVMRTATRNQKWLFNLSSGMGFLHFRESIYLFEQQVSTAVDPTVGFQIIFGTEYKFAKNWGAGLNLSLLSGIVDTFTVYQDGEQTTITAPPGEGEGVARLDLLFGIRYYFW